LHVGITRRHRQNKTEVGRRLALQAIHVAYAQQRLNGTMLPYDGFADGPSLAVASLAGNTLTLIFSNAVGMSLLPTHNCTACCKFDRIFEYTSAAVPMTSWVVVPAASVSLAGSRVTLAGVAADALAVRYAYQNFPECVLSNANQLVAGSFIANITDAATYATEAKLSPTHLGTGGVSLSDGHVALTPPMGFNSVSHPPPPLPPFLPPSLSHQVPPHSHLTSALHLLV